MAVLGLGYAGFGSDALEDWRQFGTGLVGLQAVERGNSLLAFRMDDRKQRIVIDRAMGEGTRFFGWEVADAAALDRSRRGWKRPASTVTAEPQTLADARRVRSLISFRDPGRQPAGGVLRRRDRRRRRSARAARSRASAPARSASGTPC